MKVSDLDSCVYSPVICQPTNACGTTCMKNHSQFKTWRLLNVCCNLQILTHTHVTKIHFKSSFALRACPHSHSFVHTYTRARHRLRGGCGLFLRRAVRPGPGWWSAVASPGTDCKARCHCGQRLPPRGAPRLWGSARTGPGRERSRWPRPLYREWWALETGFLTPSRCWKKPWKKAQNWQYVSFKTLSSVKADVLGKGVKAVCFLGVGEGHPHARGERGVKDHSSALKPRRQVHCGHRADTLPVQDDVLGADAVPATKASPFKTGFEIKLSVFYLQIYPPAHARACAGRPFCPIPSRTGTAGFFLLTGSAGRARLHRYQRKGSSQKACQCWRHSPSNRRKKCCSWCGCLSRCKSCSSGPGRLHYRGKTRP